MTTNQADAIHLATTYLRQYHGLHGLEALALVLRVFIETCPLGQVPDDEPVPRDRDGTGA